MSILQRSSRSIASTSFASSSLLPFARSIHVLPKYALDLNKPVTAVTHGEEKPIFLSAQKLKVLAVTYQQGLLDRLNQQVKGTDLESAHVLQTVLASAADPALALTFNYASSALNNSFFLDGLTQSSAPPPVDFLPLLLKSFGSYDLFQQALFDAIAKMESTSGWIWLVQEVNEDNTVNRLAWKISYGAGSVLVRSRLQDGSPRPLPPVPSSSSSSSSRSQLEAPQATNSRTWEAALQTNPAARPSIHFTTIQKTKSTSPIRTYPLACLSMHERTYLPLFESSSSSSSAASSSSSPSATGPRSADFSIEAKNAFAGKWLNSLDWSKLTSRLAKEKQMVSSEEKEDMHRWSSLIGQRLSQIQQHAAAVSGSENEPRVFDRTYFEGWFQGWDQALTDAERSFGVVKK